MGERMLGRKAWLVTWEWCGDHARREQPVVAIFRPQLSGERVREKVECLYAATEYTPADMLRALDDNPYPAEFGSINGVRWFGELTCGHNPYLRARLVDELMIGSDGQVQGSDGQVQGSDGQVQWQERPRPTVPQGFINHEPTKA